MIRAERTIGIQLVDMLGHVSDHALEVVTEFADIIAITIMVVVVQVVGEGAVASEAVRDARNTSIVEPIGILPPGVHHDHDIQAFAGRIGDPLIENLPAEVIVRRFDIIPAKRYQMPFVPGLARLAGGGSPYAPDTGIVGFVACSYRYRVCLACAGCCTRCSIRLLGCVRCHGG
jgi:hypothetical protein